MITGWLEMAIFSREIIGREVVDAHNEKLGLLTDLIIDKQSGSVTIAVVKLESNLIQIYFHGNTKKVQLEYRLMMSQEFLVKSTSNDEIQT